MRCRYLVGLVSLFALAAPLASAQTIDDFESGDLSAWTAEAPYYTTLSLSSPGAGGSSHALAIQETAGSQGGHSANALAHRKFATPMDCSGYATLEMDARISAGEWNGYSLRIYNNGASVALRGIHSDSSVTGFRTIRFDISGIARNKITELVVYVNRTGQNAGQKLELDNIKLSTTPVSTDNVRVLENFSSGDLTRWSDPIAPPYQASVSVAGENAPGDTSSPARCLAVQLTGNSGNALARWRPVQTMDWNDYNTLQFDVRLPVGTTGEGFSVRVYNVGGGVRLKKFVPTGSFATCQVDISECERDQVNELLFYVNRTTAYDPGASPAKPMTLRVDNIRLVKPKLPASPDVVYLDSFDTGDISPWDWAYNTEISLNSGDFVSSPYALDIKLIGTSGSAYTRRTYLYNNAPSQDWEDYKSLMFEAKVKKGADAPNYPVGFSAQIVNGLNVTTKAAGPGGGPLWFYPSGYDTWETVSLDLTQLDVDQASWIWWYVNRCLRNDFSLVSGAGQILTIDNVRLSKEPAPPLQVDNPDVDSFEDGNIADWYYVSTHEYPQGSAEYYPGVTSELTNDAASGNYALKITCLNPPASSSAYARKTLQGKWDGYKTLVFDAKVADSSTSQGFGVRLRAFSGGYQPLHEFSPSSQWQTFKVDISGDSRAEVISLLFYVNMLGGYGVAQNGSQKLLIDNIHLTNETVQTTFDTIGQAKAAGNGRAVTLKGKVCTGFYASAVPDRNDGSLRPLFFIEETDRSSALPVVIASSVTSPSEVPSGSTVDVSGVITMGLGTRYLYATSVKIVSSGADIPVPVGLSNANCGSGPSGVDTGVPDFTGLDTTGLYAGVYGKVLSVSQDANGRYWMYIDDGSGVQADNGLTGLKVQDFWNGQYASSANVGRYVRVKGFVMNDAEMDSSNVPTGHCVRAVWPKTDVSNPVQWVSN